MMPLLSTMKVWPFLPMICSDTRSVIPLASITVPIEPMYSRFLLYTGQHRTILIAKSLPTAVNTLETCGLPVAIASCR